jgi:hypothetical protein
VSVVSDPDFLIVGAGAAGGPWLREPDFKHDEIRANRRHALINDPLRQPNTRRLTEARRPADHLRRAPIVTELPPSLIPSGRSRPPWRSIAGATGTARAPA